MSDALRDLGLGILVLGIDPGVDGALAWLEDGQYLDVVDLPTVAEKRGAGTQRRVAGGQLRALLMTDRVPDVILIERVNAMPPKTAPGKKKRSAGTQSSWNFGYTVGVIHGVLQCLGWEYRLVTPQAWKRTWGITNKPKREALLVARREYPDAASQLAREKDVDRADALLIAGAAFRSWEG